MRLNFKSSTAISLTFSWLRADNASLTKVWRETPPRPRNGIWKQAAWLRGIRHDHRGPAFSRDFPRNLRLRFLMRWMDSSDSPAAHLPPHPQFHLSH